jgi:hypothetical protein
MQARAFSVSSRLRPSRGSAASRYSQLGSWRAGRKLKKGNRLISLSHLAFSLKSIKNIKNDV